LVVRSKGISSNKEPGTEIFTLVTLVTPVVVVVVGTSKDWGPENKLPELILEFAWCSLRASMEFSTVLKKNFGVYFLLLF
jgi:hypothetical protein